MTPDQTNWQERSPGATAVQVLSITHATQWADGEITAVYIDEQFIPVDSIEFADYMSTIIYSHDDA